MMATSSSAGLSDFDLAAAYDAALTGVGTNVYAPIADSASSGLSNTALKTLASLGLGGLFGGMGGSSQTKTGYQGGIPRYQAVRQAIPQTYDPNRRPGSGGRQYFTNTRYVPTSDAAGITAALQQAAQQAGAIKTANINPDLGERMRIINEAQGILPSGIAQPAPAPVAPTAPVAQPTDTTPAPVNDLGGAAQGGLIGYALGGLTTLAKGDYLNGTTDGMADKIPTTIEGKQKAALSHGEFVISADVVSALGSGNSNAGAKVLYDMMDRVRQHAHGTKKQIKPANPKKTLPA
jgi:hypothetical protein